MRIVPDQVRNEAKNIGLVVYDPKAGECQVKVTKNIGKLKTYAQPNLDVKSIQVAVNAIATGLAEAKNLGKVIDHLVSNYKFLVQFAGPYGALCEDPEEELEDLYDRFVLLDKLGQHRQTRVSRKKLLKRTRETLVGRNIAYERRVILQGLKDRPRFDFKTIGSRPMLIDCLSVADEKDLNDVRAFAYSIGDLQRRWDKEAKSPDVGFAAVVGLAEEQEQQFERVQSILGDVAVVSKESELEAFVKTLA